MQGNTVLVPVRDDAPLGDPSLGVVVGHDGMYQCRVQSFEDPAEISVQTLVSAVQADDCGAAIVAQGGDGWDDTRRVQCSEEEGRCQLAVSGAGGSDLTLAILLSLVAFRAWPRRQLR